MKQPSLKLVYSRPHELEQEIISYKNAQETVDVISMMMPATSLFYFYKINYRLLSMSFQYFTGGIYSSSSTPQLQPPEKLHKQG